MRKVEIFLLFFAAVTCGAGDDDDIQDRIICASHRDSIGMFDYKKCKIDLFNNVIPFCVYLVIPSTADVEGRDVYTCLDAKELPWQCKAHDRYYLPYTKITVDGKELHGALTCCNDDYCNEIEEPIISVVRTKRDDKWAESTKNAFPLCFWLIIIWLCISPQFLEYLKSRATESRIRAELPERLTPRPCIFGMKEKWRKEQLKAEFPSLREMQDTLRHMRSYRKCVGDDTIEEDETSINPEIYVFEQDSKAVRTVRRTYPTTKTDLAQRMIEHGPFFFDFDAAELAAMFDSAGVRMGNEPSLLALPADIWIYGNIEGSYADLFRWLNLIGWPPKTRLLFLGGLTSVNSPDSLETIALIFALKLVCPAHVHILRGSAEGEEVPVPLGNRFPLRISEAVQEVIQKACTQLPLAAIVADRLFCAHGGVPEKVKDREQISNIARPLRAVKGTTLEADLIYNTAGLANRPVPGSRGHMFDSSSEEVANALVRLKTTLLVRARNPAPYGYQFVGPSVLSLWSAPGHSGARAGAVLNVNSNNKLTLIKMAVNGTFTAPRKVTNPKAEEDKKKAGENVARRRKKAKKSDKSGSQEVKK